MRILRTTLLVGLLAIALSIPAQGANRIQIETGGGTFTCGTITAQIRIENDADLSRITLPLNLRTTFGSSQRWDDITISGPLGRGFGTLTGQQYFAAGAPPFTTDDPILISYESSILGTDCFPAGPLETVFELNFSLRYPGGMIIDTMFYPPCSGVELIQCADGMPATIDEFFSQSIEVSGLGAPFPSVEDNPVVGMAGETLQNQIVANDPGGGFVRFGLIQGPGEVDEETGIWTWETCQRDTGNHQVTAFAHNVPEACEPTGPTVAFNVQVTPRDPADINCDGSANSVDLNLLILHIFFNTPLPACP